MAPESIRDLSSKLRIDEHSQCVHAATERMRAAKGYERRLMEANEVGQDSSAGSLSFSRKSTRRPATRLRRPEVGAIGALLVAKFSEMGRVHLVQGRDVLAGRFS